MKPFRTLVVLVCLALVGVAAAISPAHAATNQVGTYFPLASSRLLDTRTANGGHQRPVAEQETMQLAVLGRGGVPSSGVSAVVLNVTVVHGTVGGFLTVFPAGLARPNVSSINFNAAETRANIATVPTTSANISIFNRNGTVHVLVDVLGYYSSAGTTATAGNEFTPPEIPQRMADTRNSDEGALASKDALLVDADFGKPLGSLNPYVKALALNVTAVGAKATGYLAAYDGTDKLPTTSTLNFAPGSNTANMVVVKTSVCTACTDPDPVRFGVYNGSSQSVDVVVDLVGIYYNDGTIGLRFHPLTPVRIRDSRTVQKPLTAGQTQVLTAPGSVATASTDTLVTNLTAVVPTATTYLVAWRGGESKPPISNLSVAARRTVANGALLSLSDPNTFNLFNAVGTTNFVIDVTGRFDAVPGSSTTGQQSTQRVAAAKSDYSGVRTTDTRLSTQGRR